MRGCKARELDAITSLGCVLVRIGLIDLERDRDGGATRRRSFDGEQTEHDLSEHVLPVLELRAVGLFLVCSREERSRGDRGLRVRGLRGRGL